MSGFSTKLQWSRQCVVGVQIEQWNSIESADINPQNYTQIIFDKVAKKHRKFNGKG